MHLHIKDVRSIGKAQASCSFYVEHPTHLSLRMAWRMGFGLAA